MMELDQEMIEEIAHQFERKIVSLGHIMTMESQEKVCPRCHRPGTEENPVAIRRRNSAYSNDDMNWLETCLECYQEDWQQLEDDWAEYYSGRL